MEAKAYAKYVRISPRKVSVVLNLIRGKDVKLAKGYSRAYPKGRLVSHYLSCSSQQLLMLRITTAWTHLHYMLQNVQYPRAQFLRELEQELRVEHLELIRKHLISL